jgi:tetraacyldisaccharide 4'-kinase
LNQQGYRKLISGQRRGFAAVILRSLLRVVSWFYLVAVLLRNFLYSAGWLRTHRVSARVISIGNITAGGTGKTPLVIWLCGLLRLKGVRCAILTRGYKLKETKLSDEPAILTKSCPEAKVIVDPDRVAGAAKAIDQFDAAALVMDDGFQHRRLRRDIDIVTIDAIRPFGYGKMLPAGLLREPPSALRRADAAVITRCDQTDGAELTLLEEKLRTANPDMMIARAIHEPVCAKSVEPKEISLEQLKGRSIFAFCGIGNPDAFFQTIKKLGLNLVGSRTYNDHYHYTDESLRDIYEEARYLEADLILTTEKDWSKAALRIQADEILLAYLAVRLKILTGQKELTTLIDDLLVSKHGQVPANREQSEGGNNAVD